ncbi:MAG: hypothetical protein WKG06_14980 [Segetibacter sp.]
MARVQIINHNNQKDQKAPTTITMRKIVNYCKRGSAFLLCILLLTSCHNANQETTASTATDSATKGLTLPQGFSAGVVADSLGSLRHLAVTKNRDIYVKLSALKAGKGILFLSDTDHDGKMDKTIGFANYPGTGIRIQGNVLYSSSNSSVYKYQLNDKEQVIDTGKAEMIVQGLVDRGNAKAIALDGNNNLYVVVGSYDETCIDAAGHGMSNCPLLDSVGGIWQFSTNKLNQSYSHAVHYARGLKNVVGLERGHKITFWNTAWTWRTE